MHLQKSCSTTHINYSHLLPLFHKTNTNFVKLNPRPKTNCSCFPQTHHIDERAGKIMCIISNTVFLVGSMHQYPIKNTAECIQSVINCIIPRLFSYLQTNSSSVIYYIYYTIICILSNLSLFNCAKFSLSSAQDLYHFRNSRDSQISLLPGNL